MWSVVVTVTASLVPKVEEEKGVCNVCCMGGCGQVFSQNSGVLRRKEQGKQ